MSSTKILKRKNKPVLLSPEKAKNIAQILNTTMCGYGIYDDWDEIIGDMIDDEEFSDQEVLKFAQQVSDAVVFVNKYADDIPISNSFYKDAVEYLKSSK